ncbi:MAG TPA: hypothetical protein DCM31_01295 [Deferribacteraceae bacterium]|jgi:hypothetical protein|nr:hypothetical protein [Deferribacteraceae bacterium]
MKVTVRLRQDKLEELWSKYNTNTLGKEINFDTAHKLLKYGDANINVRTLYKLCKLMDWEFPDYFEVEEK